MLWEWTFPTRSWTSIASPGLSRSDASRPIRIVPRASSSRSIAAPKKILRRLRSILEAIPRHPLAVRSRSLLRRPPGHAALPDLPPGPPWVRRREDRTPRLAGPQSVLHGAVRPARRPSLPLVAAFRSRRGTRPRLAHGQRVGQGVHAGATRRGRAAVAAGHRHRRNRHRFAAPLPHRRQRSGTASAPSGSAARTARKRASTCSMPGWALRNQGESAWRSWTCGRRSAPPRSSRATRRRPASSTTSSISCAIGEAMDQRPQERICPPHRRRTAATSRGRSTPCSPAGTISGRPAAPTLANSSASTGGSASLPAQGIVRPTLGLRAARLGPAVLRPLAGRR